MHKPESILENKTQKIVWDFEIQTDHLIPDRRPNRVIVNQKKKKKKKKKRERERERKREREREREGERTCLMIDFVVPADERTL